MRKHLLDQNQVEAVIHEIDAEIREMRGEREEHQLAIERLQEECARSRNAGAARALPRTVEAVDPEMVAILRAKTEAERLAIAWGMWRSARSMLANHLRSDHPDWTEKQINREIARRFAHGSS